MNIDLSVTFFSLNHKVCKLGMKSIFFLLKDRLNIFLLILVLARKVRSPFFLRFLHALNWCILQAVKLLLKPILFHRNIILLLLVWVQTRIKSLWGYCVLSTEYIFQMHPLQWSWKNIYHETLNKKDTQICLLQDHGTWVYLQGGVPTWERKYIVQKPMFSICSHMV